MWVTGEGAGGSLGAVPCSWRCFPSPAGPRAAPACQEFSHTLGEREGGRARGLHKAGDRGGGCSGLQAEPVPISPVVETGKLEWELGEGAIPPTVCLSLWRSFPKTDVSQILFSCPEISLQGGSRAQQPPHALGPRR